MPVEPRHVAIIAPPTPGHFNPLRVLGGELARLGHRVTFVHLGEAAGLVGDPAMGFAVIDGRGGASLSAYHAMLAEPTGPIGLPRMIRATAAMTALLLDRAPAVLARIGAAAVIADAAEPAGPLIAARLDLPLVGSVTGLPLLCEPEVPPPFLGWRYRADRLGRFRNRGGYQVSGVLMRPIDRVLGERRQAWGIRDAQPLVQVAQCPAGLDYPRRHLPATFRYGAPWRTATTDSLDLPADGRPLIFCSLGTLQGARRHLLATMAAACAAIGARAVIGHGGGLSVAEAAALPGDPLVRAFWPQEAVLRRCAAAVLHGGFNTVLDALAAGVPIVAVPIAFEQPGTAARLAWVGAGRVVALSGLTPDRLAQALTAVIAQPGYRASAQRLAEAMRAAGGAATAAATISAALASVAGAAATTASAGSDDVRDGTRRSGSR